MVDKDQIFRVNFFYQRKYYYCYKIKLNKKYLFVKAGMQEVSKIDQTQSNESSKLSLKNTENEGKTVKVLKRKQLVAELVKEWHHRFEVEKKDYHICYQQFLTKLSKGSNIQIHFDNSVSTLLAQLSKEIDFLQFNDKQEKENQLKKTLEFMNDILKEKHFISEKQYLKFKKIFFSNTLEDSVYLLSENLRNEGYLKPHLGGKSTHKKLIDLKNMSQVEKDTLLNLWKICIIIDMETFWRFILREKIQHRQLVVVFKVYDEILKESFKELRNDVAHFLKEWFKRRSLEDLQPIRKVQTSIVEYDHFLDLRAEEITVYLNKEKWETYSKQYTDLTHFLTKRCSQQSIRFEPYGSFKSKFFILKYSDIDVGLYFQNVQLKKRENVVIVLQKISQAINADKNAISNCLYSKTFKQEKIKIPFVKVIYNNGRGKNLQIVPTMDIIINNYEGIQNSNLLALYAEDEYVLKFCNLIKYWAVNRTLINMERKIEGLSSYGVLLMCLYYLMVTMQIPFLRKINGKYQIGRNGFKITRNFLENFIGFLQFYSYEYADEEDSQMMRYGRFHSERMMVCLMEEHDGEKMYEKDLIINMYDFIDGSNPGRMRTYLQNKFKSIFQDTLTCLYQRSISFLQIVYDYNQQTKGFDSNSRHPLRNNRYLN